MGKFSNGVDVDVPSQYDAVYDNETFLSVYFAIPDKCAVLNRGVD